MTIILDVISSVEEILQHFMGVFLVCPSLENTHYTLHGSAFLPRSN
jgi:hypothetical protein